MTTTIQGAPAAEAKDSELQSEPEVRSSSRELGIRWQNHQLLPDTFLGRRRAQDVLYGWSFVLFALVALLCGLTSFYLIRGRQIRSERARLIATAQPIDEMRTQAKQLETQNLHYRDWASQVETAVADDSVLQALLSIAKATDASRSGINVASVEVKLALEHMNPTETPQWARSRFAIAGTVDTPAASTSWLTRTREYERLINPQLQAAPGNWVDQEVRLIGEVDATRLVP